MPPYIPVDNKNILPQPESPLSTHELIRLPFLDGLILNPKRINLVRLSQDLEAGGIRFDLDESLRVSLRETQFRNYETGKGPAMAYALSERRQAFENLIQVECQSYHRVLKKSGDKTRGARQLAADLIAAAAGEITKEELASRINRRAQKSRGELDDPITGLPPQAAVKIIDFLTEPQPTKTA